MIRGLGRIKAVLEWLHLRPTAHHTASPRAAEADAAAAGLKAGSSRAEQAAMQSLAAIAHLDTANSRVQAFISSVYSEVGKGGGPS